MKWALDVGLAALGDVLGAPSIHQSVEYDGGKESLLLNALIALAIAGLGLKGMKERAEKFGGDLQIQSATNGTKVRVKAAY